MVDVELALKTALHVHAGQVDKGGAPYILHPIRLMMQMDTDAERVVALLHDCAEDSEWFGHANVEELFGADIAASIDAISKRSDEAYETYLLRVKANPVATKVKLADIRDNSDITRLRREITTEDYTRLEKYRSATAFLEA